MERNEHLTYRRLMCRLEKRFGIKELAETAQARLQQATQASGESLKGCADRILTLATKAFKRLQEHYSSKQAVIRFCEGLLDREAELRFGMDKPVTWNKSLIALDGSSTCSCPFMVKTVIGTKENRKKFM